jgi:hypothetical protein
MPARAVYCSAIRNGYRCVYRFCGREEDLATVNIA